MIDITAFGASPNNPDDTDHIQTALDSANPGDTVLVPAGTFKVNPLRSVKPKSGTILKIDGTLKAIGVDKWDSIVVNVRDVSDVSILGPGKIIGERYENRAPPPGRHGNCLQVFNSSRIKVGGNLILGQGQADGLYVEDVKDMTVDGVQCVDNARNGMSIISAERLMVTNSLFTMTHSESPMPQCGIDIEPDPIPSLSLIGITITGNRFVKNAGAGVYIAFQPAANRRSVRVVNNYFDQHYYDGSGPCIGGRNSPTANLCYASCRWIPGYDWWFFPTEFSL